jgi:hypothetical protein
VFATLLRQASLREDYLNQVQRDFLSLSFATKTPLADADTNWRLQPRYGFYDTPKSLCRWLEVVVYWRRVFWLGLSRADAPKAARVAS